MRRVRQGLLPEPDPRGAQDPAHGGVAAQVPGLRAQLQPAQQPQNPPSNPHRPQALRVQRLRQGLPAQLRSTQARPDPHGRRRSTRGPRGGPARRRQPRGRQSRRDQHHRHHHQLRPVHLVLVRTTTRGPLGPIHLRPIHERGLNLKWLPGPTTTTTAASTRSSGSAAAQTQHDHEQRQPRLAKSARGLTPTTAPHTHVLQPPKNGLAWALAGPTGAAGTRTGEGAGTREGEESRTRTREGKRKRTGKGTGRGDEGGQGTDAAATTGPATRTSQTRIHHR